MKVNQITLQIKLVIQSFGFFGNPAKVPDIFQFDLTPLSSHPEDIARNKESYPSSFRDSAKGPKKRNDGDRNTIW